MIIVQEKNKRKTKMNVYSSIPLISLTGTTEHQGNRAEIGKTTRGKREINYWGKKK